MTAPKIVAEFRGIRFKLEGSYPIKELPPIASGLDTKDFVLDRWRGYTRKDKELTKSLNEVYKDWQESREPLKVFYGVEHLAAFKFNEDFEKSGKIIDFFDLIIIRNTLLVPVKALAAAEGLGGLQVG